MRIIKIKYIFLFGALFNCILTLAQDCNCPPSSMPALEFKSNTMTYDKVNCTERDGEISCVFACNYKLKDFSNEIIVTVAWIKNAKQGTVYKCGTYPERYSIGSTNGKLAWGRTFVSKPREDLNQEAKRIAQDLIGQVEPSASTCPDAKPAVNSNQLVKCPPSYGDYLLQTNDASFAGKITTTKVSGGDLNSIGCAYQNVNTKRIIRIQGKWFSTQPAGQYTLPNACQSISEKYLFNIKHRQALVSITQAEDANYQVAKNISSDLLWKIYPVAVLCPGSLPPQNQVCKCPETYDDYVLLQEPYVGKVEELNWGEGAVINSIFCSYFQKNNRDKHFDLTVQWAVNPRLNTRRPEIGCNKNIESIITSRSKQVHAFLSRGPDPNYKIMSKVIAERMIALVEPYALPCPGKLRDELTNEILGRGTVRGKIISKNGSIEVFYPVLSRWVAYDGSNPWLYSGQKIRTGAATSATLIIIKQNGDEEYVDLGSDMSMDMK